MENSDNVVASVYIDFLSNQKRNVPFSCITYDYSRADSDGLNDHLRNVLWEDTFKLITSATASKFCGWVQVVTDVYIPYSKYKYNPHSSP